MTHQPHMRFYSPCPVLCFSTWPHGLCGWGYSLMCLDFPARKLAIPDFKAFAEVALVQIAPRFSVSFLCFSPEFCSLGQFEGSVIWLPTQLNFSVWVGDSVQFQDILKDLAKYPDKLSVGTPRPPSESIVICFGKRNVDQFEITTTVWTRSSAQRNCSAKSLKIVWNHITCLFEMSNWLRSFPSLKNACLFFITCRREGRACRRTKWEATQWVWGVLGQGTISRVGGTHPKRTQDLGSWSCHRGSKLREKGANSILPIMTCEMWKLLAWRAKWGLMPMFTPCGFEARFHPEIREV